MHTYQGLALTLLAVMALAAAPAATREYGGRYTQQRLANLRANCDRLDWAKAERAARVKAAARWLALSDEALWQFVPGNKLPRAIDVSMYHGQRPGCPVCGHDIDQFGNYPYSPDVTGRPFKLVCPACHKVFPTNDFAAFYRSGLDETGQFDPQHADRELLFNADHPDPADPLHTSGVDDGAGWFDAQGHRYLFVAYFTWQWWGQIQAATRALAEAYVYTGEQKYAHKALILLDRIADLYPEYDLSPYTKLGYYHSDGGGGKGKVEGCIWETGVVTTLATCVDQVLSGTRDDPELYQFLAAKVKQFKLPTPKGTREQLVQNLDDRILREGARAVFSQQCRGNEGMHQTSLAACAIALDTEPETSQWLDWLFAPTGGHIPQVVVSQIDRDGVGAEAAPGYALSWGANLGQVADLLADYPKYTTHSIYRDLPPFAATFDAGWRIVVSGFATPNIGDNGATGTLGRVNADPRFIARGYRYLHQPRYGLAAWYANGRKADGLARDIFAADPEQLSREIAALGQASTANPFEGGRNLAGYGLASLAYGWDKDTVALWLYYGRNGGHGHQDRLNLDLFFQGRCLLPDHGYPEYATVWPHRAQVTLNTISHNTVVVDQKPQQVNWVGHPELFWQGTGFGAVRIDSREVYPQLKQYQRTLALIKVGPQQAYAFDVFRVRGGQDHLYSLHGLPGQVTTSGLKLAKQDGGSYAGPAVPFRAEQPKSPSQPMFGYAWYGNVERDAQPAAAYAVDWKGQTGYRGLTATDDLHVRYHAFTAVDDVALADTQPPQNKQGNPKFLRYLLAHRHGPELVSTFAGLIEPYRDQPLLAGTERLAVLAAPAGAEPVALKVTLAGGLVDYLVASDDDTGLVKAAGGLEFAGAVGWLRVKDGQVVAASLQRGTRLALGEFSLTAAAPGWAGTITQRTEGTAGPGEVWTATKLPTQGSLTGRSIIIANDRQRNACYTITSASTDGERTKLHLGDVCFVRQFKDPQDYTKGYVYEFDPGAQFLVPLTAEVQRTATGWQVEASGPVEVRPR